MIFETHAHYDDKRFEKDRDRLIASLPEQGVAKVINVGADFQGCQDSIALSEQYQYVYAAGGIHPENIEELPGSYEWIRENISHKKVVAVGEIGLDYYWEKDAQKQKEQRAGFIKQLQIAKEASLPVIIHSRDAAADTFEIIKNEAAGRITGVVHCYSYSKEYALEYVKMGYYIGIGGVVTFKNAKKLKETAAAVDLKHILLETDCPYMAPEPYRGKRNDSTLLKYVAEEIAKIKQISVQEVIEQTAHNADKLFLSERRK
jgi:hydrolase, TatD family